MGPRRRTGRHLETSTFTAVLPVLALVPAWLLALVVFWFPLRLVWGVPYWLAVVVHLGCSALLFLRPAQRLVLTRLLGARRPTAEERAVLEGPWRAVAQAARVPARRFVLAVVDADELNAFACGGHLVVVTTYAIDFLPERELCGVLAHELSHHLGLHTVALTIGQWLALPIVVLARIGFFLQAVARAATDSFASGSAVLTFVGRLVSTILTMVGQIFLLALTVSELVGNVVGREAEFQADRRAVETGFGAELASALRRFVSRSAAGHPDWRDRLFTSHPPARTRVARIEALLRSRGRTAR
jgi:Zn-dependent protease with chaperone function